MAEILSILKPGETDNGKEYPDGQYVVSLTKDEAEWILSVANYGNRGEAGERRYYDHIHRRIFDGFHSAGGLDPTAWMPEGMHTFAMERKKD